MPNHPHERLQKKSKALSMTIIRQATQADAEQYRELRLRALKKHPEAFGSDYTETLARPLEGWHAMLRPIPGKATFVAERGSELGGMSVIVAEEGAKVAHSAHIYSVYVCPEWRGQALGQRLIQSCLDWARQHSILQVKLSVTVTNVAAIALYLKCGFQVYGVDPKDIFTGGKYYDELLMVVSPKH